MLKKSTLITVLISSLIFLFMFSMIYLIYCYSFYDIALIDKYITKFNDNDISFVYENMDTKEYTIDDFKLITDVMFDKNVLQDIYNTYYLNSNNYESLDEFINNYYYGNNDITKDDVEFTYEGKSTINSRRKIKYKKIKVNNGVSDTVIGFVSNITFEIEDNSVLYVDDKLLSCENNVCSFDEMIGGIHQIKYISNGNSYYGIVNVNSDNLNVNVSVLDSLVIYSTSKPDNKIDLFNGEYKVEKCYLSMACANKKTTYIRLFENGVVEYYIYINYDQAGDYYKGTYEINNGFLTLHFDEHVYYVFDYDTKVTTKIPATTDISYQYKILSENSFENENYRYKLS